MPDIKDWLEYIKDIKPLNKKQRVVAPIKKRLNKTSSPVFVADIGSSNGIDGSTQKKFNKEKFEISATLDLHGFTYDTAYDAVLSFIKRSYLGQKRCVLIITGKGEVLKEALPKWLENKEIKNLILQIKQPSQSLGGSGAFMLLIKRIRS